MPEPLKPTTPASANTDAAHASTPTPSRRAFLRGAALALGGWVVTGCSLDPSSKAWGLPTWAERVSQALLGTRRMAKEYPRTAITRTFPIRSLTLPEDYADGLADWQL